MKNKTILINIWDDYYDDGYVPEGKKQETFIYVENDEPQAFRKETLAFLLKHIQDNNLLPGVKLWMTFYESRKKYPQLVGTDNEWMLFERWEIRVEGITHLQREGLVKILEKTQLEYGENFLLNVYSES